MDKQLAETLTGWRRHLHAHPELSLNESKTSAFVCERLKELGIPFVAGVGGHGVVATITRGNSNRSVGLRADMDALPIHEQTGAAHASVNPGIMHACGHDGHVAMLLAAARLASRRDDLDGIVHFIFQPAEEVEGGARAMVADGLFRDFPTEAVYGLHNWPALRPGETVARDGAMMAAFATFEIEVVGRGAHGAMPHEGADPVLCAGQLVSALQAVAARNVSPLKAAVLSVTQIHGGDAYNVIPEAVALRGTTRWFEPEVGDLIEERLGLTAARVCEAFGCKAHVRYERRYPATINAPQAAGFLREAAARSGLAVVDAEPSMAAEDFAFMLEARPGAYLWLGAGKDGENPGLHSPRFDFNDAILASGIGLWNEAIGMALGRG